MADGEELSFMQELSKENPIGPAQSYVNAKQHLSNSERTTIDSLHFTEHNTREVYNRTVYNYTDSVNDLTGLEDDEINTVSNADVKKSVPFLPRLVFLDSDENILSNTQLDNRNIDDVTENRLRSVSDSLVLEGHQNTFKPLQKQIQEDNYSGYTNQISKVSIQSSDSDLLTDHNVMDTDQTEINMTILRGGKRIQKSEDKNWHCHLRNTKIPPDKIARNQLIAVSILCFLFMIGEAIGGALSNSLALFTDVLHLGSDLISFLVSLLAIYLSQKPATKTMSFGYHRAEVLGALMSVFIIWSVTGVLVYMAVERIINEHYKDVKADEMLITAILGVVFNFVMGVVLHSELCCKRSTPSFGHNHSHGSQNQSNHVENHSNYTSIHSQRSSDNGDEDREPLLENEDEAVEDHEAIAMENHGTDAHPKNINVRAAFIHVLGDIIQSIGVLISSLIIKLKPEDHYRLADPICTFLFSILVLLTTITVLRDTLQIIMEGVPRGFNYYSIKNGLQNIEGVEAVHGLSVWCLTLEKNALAVHLAVGPTVNQKKVLQDASEFLQKNYNFVHTTIQVEDYTQLTAQCPDCQELHK